MAKKDYDYIVIGGGPAGYRAALNLAKAKKHVALVERRNIHGENISRDIPFAINQEFAHSFYQTTSHPAVNGQPLRYDLPTLISHQEHVISLLHSDLLKKLQESQVTVINGSAKFIDNDTITVGSNEYTASNYIIATGAKLKTTGISGLDTVNYVTPDSCTKVKRLPKFVFVAGGGSTGCEIAEYFAKLGTKVIIMERGPHLLPREDKEIGDELSNYFTDELGILVVTNAKVTAIEQENYAKKVIFTTSNKRKFVRVDCVVLATGSEPDLDDLGLENTNVTYKNTGIMINKTFQTTSKHIFAIGDALGMPNSTTDLSEAQASILTSFLLRKTKPTSSIDIVRRVNTYPGIATIGYNEYDLLARDRKYHKFSIKLSDLPLAKITNSNYGLIKVLLDTNNRMIGASIMAPNATEIAISLLPFIKERLPIGSITPFNYPSDSVLSAIKQFVQDSK